LATNARRSRRPKFLAESIVHTQDTITAVTDPKDEDCDAGKYTLETIVGILSGAVTAVTDTPPPDLSARAGAATDQHAKAAGSEAGGEAIDFTSACTCTTASLVPSALR
jgi:hypothetical protein